jgi:CubicO group peptidase (beta-lactamase class C family)
MDTCVFPSVFGESINYKICANSELITVHHLLTHTTGSWPTTTRTVDPMFSRPSMNHKLLIQSVLYETSLNNLGDYCYSNFGYCILGRVIEKLSGLSFIDFIRSEF